MSVLVVPGISYRLLMGFCRIVHFSLVKALFVQFRSKVFLSPSVLFYFLFWFADMLSGLTFASYFNLYLINHATGLKNLIMLRCFNHNKSSTQFFSCGVFLSRAE